MEDRITKGILAHLWLKGDNQMPIEIRFRTTMQNMGKDYPFRQLDITPVLEAYTEKPLKKDQADHLCLALLHVPIKRGLKVTYTDGKHLYFPVPSEGALVSYYVKLGLSNRKADLWKNEFLQDKEKKWKGDEEYYSVPLEGNPLLGFFQESDASTFVTDIQRFVQKKWLMNKDVSLADRGFFLNHTNQVYLVTDHVIEQWRERSVDVFGEKKAKKMTTPEGVIHAFKTMLSDGKHLKRKNHLKQILKNNFRLSWYLGWEGWIIVIEEGNVIKTVYYKGPTYEGYKVKHGDF